MLFIEYPPCSTCQKAKKWLDERGISYTARHIKEEKPTSGLLYKSLNLKERLPQMSEEEQLRLLATDGMLVKRPILVCGEKVTTGFKVNEWEAILTQK